MSLGQFLLIGGASVFGGIFIAGFFAFVALGIEKWWAARGGRFPWEKD